MEKEKRTKVIDQPSVELEKLLASDDWTASYVSKNTVELIQRARRSSGYPSEAFSGEAAAVYLEQLIEAITGEIKTQVQGYSAARWLWYLRRLPERLLAGSYRTTAAYDGALAESLSWYSTKMECSISDKYFAFRVDTSSCRHLLKFVAAVKLLSHLHVAYRHVGKGGTLVFEHSVPYAEQSEVIAEAIATYDLRHDQGKELPLASLGLAGTSTSLAVTAASLKGTDSPLFLFNACIPIWIPLDIPSLKGGIIEATVLAQHIPTSLPIDSFLKPYDGMTTQELPFLKELEPVILLLMLFPVLSAELPAALSNTFRFGYCVVSPVLLEKLFSLWLPSVLKYLCKIAPEIEWSTSYEEWRGRIHHVEPSMWPLRSGGVVRESIGMVLLDFSSASRTLINRAVVDRQAFDLSNIRADTFEIQVRRIVEKSGWDGTPYSGRKIRREGKVLTDIDASAERSDILILISCKSLIYDVDYDKGDYRVVSNAQYTVDKAVVAWLGIIEDIKKRPIGDNFDFSRYTQIIGIVCTPFVIYSDNDVTLEFAKPGLRRCVAAYELRDWLEAADALP